MIILDSNIWIAYLNMNDSQHAKADMIFIETERSGSKIVLSEYLILEITSVLAMKVSKQSADDFLKLALNNSDIVNIASDNNFFEEVVSLFKKQKNQKLSFVDVSLLYLSKNFKVATFDENLQKAIKLQN
jgi:predicted nucleic acid-binding protein